MNLVLFCFLIFQCVCGDRSSFGNQFSLQPAGFVKPNALVAAPDANLLNIFQNTDSLKSMIHNKNFISEALSLDPVVLRQVLELLRSMLASSNSDIEDINQKVSDALANKTAKQLAHEESIRVLDDRRKEVVNLDQTLVEAKGQVVQGKKEVDDAKLEVDAATTAHQNLVDEHDRRMPELSSESGVLEQVIALLEPHLTLSPTSSPDASLLSILQNTTSLKSMIRNKNFVSDVLSMDPYVLAQVLELLRGMLATSKSDIDDLNQRVSDALGHKTSAQLAHEDAISELDDNRVVEVERIEGLLADAKALVLEGEQEVVDAKDEVDAATTAHQIFVNEHDKRMPGLLSETDAVEQAIALLEPHLTTTPSPTSSPILPPDYNFVMGCDVGVPCGAGRTCAASNWPAFTGITLEECKVEARDLNMQFFAYEMLSLSVPSSCTVCSDARSNLWGQGGLWRRGAPQLR